jgi:hypothetical protein
MKDDDRQAAGSWPARGIRTSPWPPGAVAAGLATAVGVWLGVSAPEVSPVSASSPAVQTFQAEPAPPAGSALP